MYLFLPSIVCPAQQNFASVFASVVLCDVHSMVNLIVNFLSSVGIFTTDHSTGSRRQAVSDHTAGLSTSLSNSRSAQRFFGVLKTRRCIHILSSLPRITTQGPVTSTRYLYATYNTMARWLRATRLFKASTFRRSVSHQLSIAPHGQQPPNKYE